MSSYGMNLTSVVFIALIVERGAATAYRAVYEQLSSTCGLVLMILTCQIVALGMSISFALCKWAPRKTMKKISVLKDHYYVQTLIVLGVDLISMGALLVLYGTNSSLRQIKFRYDSKLSQRYQIHENIRAVYTLLPLIVVGILFSIFGIAASAIQNVISSAFRLRLPIYNLIMNLYVLLAFLIAIRRDLRLRHSFLRLLNCGKKKVNDVHIETVKVKNVFGKTIIADNSAKFHFDSLHNMWD